MLATTHASSSLLTTPTEERVVRFNDECVLIPQSSVKRPRLSTKSYSLPLWKKKSYSGCSDDEPDDHVVLKVVVPSFKSKSRPSSTETQPLPPCLVHREPPSPARPSPSHPIINLTPSPSSPSRGRDKSQSRRVSHPPVTTVPLRACCPDCFHITEECLKEGESWEEHFSCGARRMRSSSLERRPPPTALHHSAHHARSASSGAIITVDEMDRRRRGAPFFCDLSLGPPSRYHDRRSSGSTTSDSDAALACAIATIRVHNEDDEDELFPLPSPRRSPAGSKDSLSQSSPDASPHPPAVIPPSLRNLVDAAAVPSSPPSSPTTRQRASSISSAVLRAGADVLKGVSSINAPGLNI